MEKQESYTSPRANQQINQDPDFVFDNKNAVNSSINSKGGNMEQTEMTENQDSQRGKKHFYDKKFYQKKSGKYQPSILEQVKELVKKEDIDLPELCHQKIWQELSPEEKKQMKKFFINIRQKEKRTCQASQVRPEPTLIITEEQQNIISNVQVSRNELISNELSASQNIENQIAVMIKHNRLNHLAILDFLKSLQQVPFENFFEVLIEVIKAVENSSQQTRLLVSLCGIYNGQKIQAGVDLCGQTLKYLANEDGVTSQQVIGFLKFTFVTNGDLHNSDLNDLIKFDQRHRQCFVGLKHWLQWTFQIPPDLALVLPNSCYILGLPFAKKLKSDSTSLCKHIPSEFLAVFIQIIAFSFEKDESQFLHFLNVSQYGFLEMIEKIQKTQLLNLFNALVREVQEHNNQWYLNLTNSTKLIEGALTLVKENKISIFDQKVCKNLLLDSTNIEQYMVSPSYIKNQTTQDNESQYRLFLQLNSENQRAQNFLKDFRVFQKKLFTEIFSVLQIVPHFIQELAMQIVCNEHNYPHMFLNIAPGLGKTKLILAQAIYFVRQKQEFPVVILNTNQTLLHRDFQEAKFSLEKFQISCASVLSQQAKIFFLTTQDFIAQHNKLPSTYHIILDEYHNIFFNESIFDIIGFLEQASSFTGYSGSPLIPTQRKLLECCFNKQGLVLQLSLPNNLTNHETIICQTQTQHLKQLSKISEQFRTQVPQVFILDSSTTAALMKGKKKQPYIALINQEPHQINTTLSKLFNQPRDDGSYGTFIINEEMGTGTDFKTSTDIENRGGLVLVYGVRLENASTFQQLSSRVGRIFNKSRRFYIIQDSSYVGSSKDYLQFQLEIIKQKEDTDARALLNKLKKYNSTMIDTYNKAEIQNQEQVAKTSLNQSINLHKKRVQKDAELQQSSTQKGLGIEQTDSHQNQRKSLYPQTMEECKSCKQDYIGPHICKEADGIVIENADFVIVEDNGNYKDFDITSEQHQMIQQKQDVRDTNIKDDVEMLEIKQADEKEPINIVEEPSNLVGLGKRPSPAQKNDKIQDKLENKCRGSNFLTKRQKAIVDVNINKQQPHKTQRDLINEKYFLNYGKKKVQKAMLDDHVRINSYQEAINKLCKGNIVLDLGCGTGILSLQALQAGATRVIGIDNADVSKLLHKDLQQFGIKFKYIKNTIENLAVGEEEPQVPQVDLIVSEWMGYFLLFENMIESYILAIQKFLNPNGIMIPSQATMYFDIASIDTKITPKRYLQETKSAYYKFAQIEYCQSENLLSYAPINIKHLDFTDKSLKNPLDGEGLEHHFQIQVSRKGIFNAFVGSFSARLCDGVFLNTMPGEPDTHWKQSLFFIETPLTVEKDDVVKGIVYVIKDEDNFRNLNVRITYMIVDKGVEGDDFFTFDG